VKYVSGRLNVGGYTVVAVGYNGKVAFSKAPSFKIAAPDTKVTLQLVNSHGLYAGPVVFGGSASRVITGIKAGANVAMIDVVPSKGYAHVARKLASAALDNGRWAFAKHGVPIGNGLNLGLVVSNGKGGGSGPGGDQARIGIPNEIDIAVPGRHQLKALAPATLSSVLNHASSRASAARARSVGARFVPLAVGGGETPPPGGNQPPPGGNQPPPNGEAGSGAGAPQPSAISPWMSQMFLTMDETINEDAAGTTVAQIDSAMQSKLNLKLLNVPTNVSLLELACNGLSFCSQGGTGQAVLEGLPASAPAAPPSEPGQPNAPPANTSPTTQTVAFPSGSLDSATGFGEVVGPAVPNGMIGNNAGGGHEFSLNPNATSSQIGSGDVITEAITDNGTTTQIPTTIGFVFNTVPAIASYSDTAGNSGTISYPDTSKLGTMTNPIKVAAGPNGDVVVTFTLFRPQRQGIAGAGEPAFMDIGHLGYELDFAGSGGSTSGSNVVGSTTPPQCPASSYSNQSSTLTLVTGGSSQAPSGTLAPPTGMGEMIDSANDQPASSANTISFAVDLTQCLAAKGESPFPIGQVINNFDISANSVSSADHANQTFSLERTR
jgi:hypothetical protein